MDAAGFGLTAIELCIKVGKQLHAVCQKYQHADREIRENILWFEAIWLKTQSQIETLRDLWGSLDERMQIHQSTVLSLLYEKLQVGVALLQGLDPLADDEPSLRALQKATGGDLKKFKYASSVSKRLEKVMRELDRWQKVFDPSWYLLTRAAALPTNQQITTARNDASRDLFILQELRRVQEKNSESSASKSSIFLPHDYSVQGTKSISKTSAQAGYAAGQAVIIDVTHISDGKNAQETTKDVRDIAQILATVDPNVFGLLACRGVKKRYNSAQVTGFDFIFAIPIGLANPRSLRTFLLSADPRCSLDGRFQLAKLLARSVSFLHTAQIVHKNISPETIILLESLNRCSVPCFEKFRRAEGRTYMRGDLLWEKILYRHPQRQGEQPEEMYKMQHDIYSLGVCLLEIGLGISFVDFDLNSVSDRTPRGAIPNAILEIADHLKNKDIRARAFQIKRRLVNLAEERLPGAMGNVYTKVVVSCLTCLDPGNQEFGDESEFLDEDGILVGIRYIEKVSYSLEEIRF